MKTKLKKLKYKILMKHSMHNTRDIEIAYDIDLFDRKIDIETSFIDSELIMSFMKFTLRNKLNDFNDAHGTKLSIIHFDIVIKVKDIAYQLKLVKRDFEPYLPTLVFEPL